MGAALGRLWGKKKCTRDELQKIRDEIVGIEEFKQSTQDWHKKLIGYLLAYFSVIYFLAAIFVYFKYFKNPRWADILSQLKLLAPFIVTPFVFLFLKRALTWWYHRKIKRNEVKLDKLKTQRSNLLDDVMERETYKVAKELLDEFASDHEKASLNISRTPSVANRSLNVTANPSKMDTPKASNSMIVSRVDTNMELRRRANANTPGNPSVAANKPANPKVAPNPNNTTLGSSFIQPERLNDSPNRRPTNNQRPIFNRGPSGPPLPRPVLPRDRGVLDRVVEYLVGDGPGNRYALICRQCQSHNGMALKEEFEYIAYRCCYCHYWNPARKQRPTAPKLELVKRTVSTESVSSSSSGEDGETAADEKTNASKAKEEKSEDAKESSQQDNKAEEPLTEETPADDMKKSK